jgi:ubiquinone biosynthesis protein
MVCEPVFEKPLKDISFSHVLLSLFRTAQRYDMEIQPQLVLLQKTLLNIEGLGRQLYPELDLWKTAHPFLERWLKRRFSPKTLWNELKRYGPEWMEKFPQVPHLILNSLQQLQNVGQLAPGVHRTAQELHDRNLRSSRRYWLSAGLIVAAIVIANPDVYEFISAQAQVLKLSVASIIFGGLGVLVLISKRS